MQNHMSLTRFCTICLIVTDEDKIRFQGAYVKELLSATDYPFFDIDAVCEIFLEWEQHKHDDIMGFRNNSYRYLFSTVQFAQSS